MRTLFICAIAASLVGCSSCPLPPQAGVESCTDANEFACLHRTAASHPIELRPVSSRTKPATEIKSTIAAKTDKPSSSARDRDSIGAKPAKSTVTEPKVEPAASRIGANTAAPHKEADAVANSNTRTIQEQVAAATAVAERTTVANVVPALRNNADLLVALLLARPEIKSLSDLTGKIIAIDGKHLASTGSVRTAIVAAGAPEVQLIVSQTKAINRLISGEVPAAVLALLSPEAAAGYPEIAGFTIFRIPISPRSL